MDDVAAATFFLFPFSRFSLSPFFYRTPFVMLTKEASLFTALRFLVSGNDNRSRSHVFPFSFSRFSLLPLHQLRNNILNRNSFRLGLVITYNTVAKNGFCNRFHVSNIW
jgi:hypothetical protein